MKNAGWNIFEEGEQVVLKTGELENYMSPETAETIGRELIEMSEEFNE